MAIPPALPRRFVSLDALRGVAALSVVLSHVAEPGDGPAVARVAADVLAYGRTGVVLFFVISGFCIHLRWARARAEGRAEAVDFAAFWRRRFVRLYPPYLAALGLYLAAGTWDGSVAWDRFGWYDLIMHLLMLHNLDGRIVFRINGVFWTLAIEEQLYLAYFLLLPLRERWGWGRTLVVCAAARVGWFALSFGVGRFGGGERFHLSHDSGSPAHWLTWALGAVAVEAAVGLIALPAWASRLRVGGLCCLAAAGCDYAAGHHLGGGAGWRLAWLVGSPLWGLGFFVLVNRLIRVEAAWRGAGRVPRPVRVAAGLGLFSYSIYLMHNLVLIHLRPALLDRAGLPDDLLGRLLLVGPVLVLGWAFFATCERPCLDRASRAVGPARRVARAGAPEGRRHGGLGPVDL